MSWLGASNFVPKTKFCYFRVMAGHSHCARRQRKVTRKVERIIFFNPGLLGPPALNMTVLKGAEASFFADPMPRGSVNPDW